MWRRIKTVQKYTAPTWLWGIYIRELAHLYGRAGICTSIALYTNERPWKGHFLNL